MKNIILFFALLFAQQAIGQPKTSFASMKATISKMNFGQQITDVLVYGGTSGGCIAAVQAAEMGFNVDLICNINDLGGMSSAGLCNVDLGSFNTTNIQGLTRTYLVDIANNYTSNFHDPEPHVAEQTFELLVSNAQVHIYRGMCLASVSTNGQKLVSATMTNGVTFFAKQFIDASYEGDLMSAAGVSNVIGREANSQYGETYNGVRYPNTGGNQFGTNYINPYITWNVPSSGILPQIAISTFTYQGAADNNIMAYSFRLCMSTSPTNKIAIAMPVGYNALNYEFLGRLVQIWVYAGFSPTPAWVFNIHSTQNNEYDFNNGGIQAIGGPVSLDFIGNQNGYATASYVGRDSLYQSMKTYTQGLLYFLATDSRMPYSMTNATTGIMSYGYAKNEWASEGNFPPILYDRESRRMVGDYMLTESNLFGYTSITDSVGIMQYDTLDLHNAERIIVNGFAENEGDVEQPIPQPWPFPYHALVPLPTSITNILVPWCVSASHSAFGNTRFEVEGMILGQAAGCAAALAIESNCAVQNVNIPNLQTNLVYNYGQKITYP